MNESYLWLFETETGERKELTPRPAEAAEKVAYRKARFAKDGKGIYVTTDRESEFRAWLTSSWRTGKHTYLSPDAKWDVDDWDLSPDGKSIAYTLNENGVSTAAHARVVGDKAGATRNPPSTRRCRPR